MFTRTAAQADTPEREKLHEEQYCPPHDFMPTWGNPANATNGDDTVPVALCSYCGTIMPLKLLG